MMPASDRLQVLLDLAREANEIERNRVPLEAFLAGFHQEDEGLDKAQLKQIQLTIYESLCGLLNDTTLVPRTSQTIAATASCAVQTDAATVSLWDLLPKARNEAYDRGFHAGKNDGYAQGVGQSNSIGKKEGLAIRFEKGQPEGLKGGLARGKEVEIQRGIGIGREAGYANSLAEGIRQAKEEIKKQGQEDTSAHKPQEITTREKIVVKLPPTSAAIILKKQNEERAKPKSSGVDPFASLLDLARKK